MSDSPLEPQHLQKLERNEQVLNQSNASGHGVGLMHTFPVTSTTFPAGIFK